MYTIKWELLIWVQILVLHDSLVKGFDLKLEI